MPFWEKAKVYIQEAREKGGRVSASVGRPLGVVDLPQDHSALRLTHALLRVAFSLGPQVLVHCAAGINRSGFMVTAYVMLER